MSSLREYLPLKQGLRQHNGVWSKINECCLREYLPLKQGLRHIVNGSSKFLCLSILREYLPLKQGLRLIHIVLRIFVYTQRVSSIKTRIKTHSHCA